MRSMPNSTYDEEAAHEAAVAEQAAIQASLPGTDAAPSAVPEGAETVTVDGEEVSPEEIAAAANRPGPNLVEDSEAADAEAVETTVKVALVADSPVDEVYVGVPGLDPDADYVSVVEDVVVDDREEEVPVEAVAVRVTPSPIELPAVIGELVAETSYVEVVN